MKKTTTLALLSLLFATVHSYAQDKSNSYQRNFKYGVGLSTGLPLNDPYQVNVGADARVQYNISENYSLTFTTGYNNLSVKDGASIGYIPVKVGYKTFLFSNEFYVMGEFGGAFSVTKDANANSILFSPSIGYGAKSLDISLRYEFLKDFPIVKDNQPDNGLAQIMVRVAYGFDL
ncbi:hypothetical protein FFWV33_08690 [Flavobacterium faecale]|uniref:Outer membrane protein beta-barrel domain-containing protein n=1 Tax=Flavobacterium faecale TaxID=1355330 RepID=A0A2S1LCZ7_9FLAO|nr:hypothetical protein [Flavobacterium faecale]AWG21604.1 hypothetical protein FFWV33_08690 [Flavobacterium faecale]